MNQKDPTAGMYKPQRNASDWFMSDWAEIWLQREGGWESKIYELAGFDPLKFKRLRSSCTLLELATAWKTKVALSDYAWNEPLD